MTAELQSASESKEAPVDVAFVKALVEEHAAALATKTFIPAVADALSTKSTQHKFLVQVTTVSNASVDADLGINAAVGAVWDAEKDGYVSFKVATDAVHLVTVYWIYVD